MFSNGDKGEIIFVQTDAGTANGLIGSRWLRNERADDAYDDVKVVGVFQLRETFELVYSPVSFGEAFTADPEEFLAAYKRHDELSESLRDLEQKIKAVLY